MPRQFTIAEEHDLIRRAQAGDQAARDTLITDHHWLIKKVVRRYSRVRVDTRPELMQAGVVGLLEAIVTSRCEFELAIAFGIGYGPLACKADPSAAAATYLTRDERRETWLTNDYP